MCITRLRIDETQGHIVIIITLPLAPIAFPSSLYSTNHQGFVVVSGPVVVVGGCVVVVVVVVVVGVVVVVVSVVVVVVGVVVMVVVVVVVVTGVNWAEIKQSNASIYII